MTSKKVSLTTSPLAATLAVSKVRTPLHGVTDQSNNSWVRDILQEIQNETLEAVQEPTESEAESAFLNIDYQIEPTAEKTDNNAPRIILECSVVLSYWAQCSQSLEPFLLPIEFSFSAGFYEPADSQGATDLFQDEVSSYYRGKTLEVYFLDKKRSAPVGEAIREQILLHLPNFPLKPADG